ncbi:MAG TPA: hypothetical protein DIW47_05010 [Bacteroidetes bacterium]|nr:hypothetical protein [Bacteroidota bacterium]
MYSIYSTGIDYMGYVNVGGTIAPWNTDMKVVKFPFKFNTSFTSYYKNYDEVAGYVTTTYDGYGTIKLPDTSFTNVYRLKTYDSVSVSVFEYRYEYFTGVDRLMTMTVKANGSKETKYFYHKKSGGTTGIANSLENSFSVYPNPSRGSITIKFNGKVNKLCIYNSLGQVIREEKIDREMNDYFQFELKNGSYIIELTGDIEIIQKRVIVSN